MCDKFATHNAAPTAALASNPLTKTRVIDYIYTLYRDTGVTGLTGLSVLEFHR